MKNQRQETHEMEKTEEMKRTIKRVDKESEVRKQRKRLRRTM